MPLLKIHPLGNQRAWSLWQITETEQELSFLSMETCPEGIVNVTKRLEYLAGRALIQAMLKHSGLTYQGIRKDEFGKPYLKELSHHISLSHSYPLAAAQMDPVNPVGIDVEQPKEKLRTVAHRVFSPSEVNDAGNDLVKLCIYWCAKEALYKIYGQRNLLFTDHLKVMPFSLAASGDFVGKIQLSAKEVSIQLSYLVMQDFVVVYTDSQKG